MGIWNQTFDDLRKPYFEGKDQEKKSKGKRWQDDDGDGKWYEKSDVDGKISKREKEAQKKHAKEDATYGYDKKGNSLNPKDKKKKKKSYEAYTVTNADKTGNTKAYQNFVAGMKSKVTGKPMYKAADHMKTEEKKEKNCGCGKDPCETYGDHRHADDKKKVSESMKQARKNVGASTCWDGYKAKGTKKKGGKVVPNCVKEDENNVELIDERGRDDSTTLGDRALSKAKRLGQKRRNSKEYKSGLRRGTGAKEYDNYRLARKQHGNDASSEHQMSRSKPQRGEGNKAKRRAGQKVRNTRNDRVVSTRDGFKVVRGEHLDWRADLGYISESDCDSHGDKKAKKQKRESTNS